MEVFWFICLLVYFFSILKESPVSALRKSWAVFASSVQTTRLNVPLTGWKGLTYCCVTEGNIFRWRYRFTSKIIFLKVTRWSLNSEAKCELNRIFWKNIYIFYNILPHIQSYDFCCFLIEIRLQICCLQGAQTFAHNSPHPKVLHMNKSQLNPNSCLDSFPSVHISLTGTDALSADLLSSVFYSGFPLKLLPPASRCAARHTTVCSDWTFQSFISIWSQIWSQAVKARCVSSPRSLGGFESSTPLMYRCLSVWVRLTGDDRNTDSWTCCRDWAQCARVILNTGI